VVFYVKEEVMARKHISESFRESMKKKIGAAGYSGGTSVTAASVMSGQNRIMAGVEQALDEVYNDGESVSQWIAAMKADYDKNKYQPSLSDSTGLEMSVRPQARPEDSTKPTPLPELKVENFEGPNKVVLDVDELETIIRQEAKLRNIDEDTAVAVWKSEGGAKYQSTVKPSKEMNVLTVNGFEASYGPLQLYVGGGLGNDYEKLTGRNLAEDNTPEGIRKQVQFALDMATKKGWTPWKGAKRIGLSPRAGLADAQPVNNWKTN
jgi:hypothetical protein